MSTYASYQCSICRRVKDVIRDNVRATPNQCTITKGCEGRLFKIGESNVATTVAPRSDLIDWYPRGEKQTVVPVDDSLQSISLSCSATGVLTLAIYQTDAEAAARTTLTVQLTQRRVEDVSYQQYLFRPTTPTTLISGRDSAGKNLRFDQTMINEGRVFVRVNGVARFPGPTIALGGDPLEIQLSPNTVVFNSDVPALSTIDVSVYLEKDTIERTLTFTANRSFTVNNNSGAWGNIRYVNEYGSNGVLKPNKWWLYSCTGLGSIVASSRLKFGSIFEEDGVTVVVPPSDLANVRFLIASEPRENTDRYLNFFVDCAVLNEAYSLSSITDTISELYADIVSLKEIYPPLQLVYNTTLANSSFVTADTFVTSSAISTDTPLSRLTGKKIIGPI